MSRFLFNEFIIEAVCADMETMNANIAESEKKIRQAKEKLSKLKGFGSEGIAAELEETSGKRILYMEDFQKAISVLRYVRNTVDRYAYLTAVADYYDSIKNQENFGNEFKPYSISKYNSRYDNWKVYAGGILNGFSYIEEGAAGIFNGKGFQEQIEYNNTRNSLEQILQNISSGEYEYKSGADEETMKNVFKVLKQGKNLDEILNTGIYDTTMKNYLKGIDELVDIKELSEEILISWYSDYSEAITYLDALSQCGVNSDYVPQIIDELKKEYSDKFWDTIDAVMDKAKEEAVSQTIEIALTATWGGGAKAVYSLEKFAFDITGKVTGLNDVSEAFDTLNGLIILENNTAFAYNQIAEKLKSGYFTEVDVENYRRLFEINRATKISEYEALMRIDNDTEYQVKYQQAISELRSMLCPI